MKFFNLLQKELKELLNAQMIIGFVVIMVLFYVMGNVMGTTISEAVKEEYTVTISDRDDTDYTHKMIAALEEDGAKVTNYPTSGDDYAAILEQNDLKNIVIIPEGFTDAVNSGDKPELIKVSRMKSASMMAGMSADSGSTVDLISKYISNDIAAASGLSDEDIEYMEDPVEVSDKTVINDKSADISSSVILGKVMMQSAILPIIIFILIIMTSQTLVNAIATEKIDKTLETLLSAPVSRTSIIGAKMLAAAIVAMLQAVVYTIGFSGMMAGSMMNATGDLINTGANITPSDISSAVSEVTGSSMTASAAMAKLGLSLTITDYLLVGVQLFLTILICLSVSIMLGALVNDSKSSQTIMLPLMMAAMIPYFITLFADVNSMPTFLKVLVYAIPFTHTFSAIPNLMFGHDGIFWFGIVYQLIFFFVCMFFALKLFNSDKILTVSLNFGQKSKFKKKGRKYTDE